MDRCDGEDALQVGAEPSDRVAIRAQLAIGKVSEVDLPTRENAGRTNCARTSASRSSGATRKKFRAAIPRVILAQSGFPATAMLTV